MQLSITDSAYNQLIDVGKWLNEPNLPWIMQAHTKVTESDLTDGNQSITRLNWIPTRVNYWRLLVALRVGS